MLALSVFVELQIGQTITAVQPVVSTSVGVVNRVFGQSELILSFTKCERVLKVSTNI